MKRILIAGATIASLLTTNALAADLAPRPYTKAPVIVDPGYNWTGFYVGLNGGYSWGRATDTAPIGAPFPGAATLRQNVDGGLAGGQIGYNWQVDRKWVLGVEADGQWSGERGRSNDVLGTIRIGAIGLTASSAVATDFPWFATFRGRAGFLVDPSLLLYGTGGLAVGEVRFANTATLTAQLFDGNSNTPIGAPVSASATVAESQTRVGWTVGGGLEKKFAPNWSAKAEYLYMDFGSKTYFGGTANAVDVRFRDHVGRVGINYQFTAGPVVAKY
ncbi:MAG: porin family protein [Rhizobiales bacterium]|nr:porin family protein [Hyphomicrobiales bacterium]